MPWFHGPSLLEFLETVPVYHRTRSTAFRFPVQRVIRPDQNFRGYAGQIASGVIRPGDAIVALPSGRRSRVKTIDTFDGPLEEAFAPMSVTLTLEDELDISRGDLISAGGNLPEVSRQFEASVVWMNERPLDPGKTYLLKHTSQTTPAEIKKVQHRVNVLTLAQERVDHLDLNEIGTLEIETARPIFFDTYKENRITGGFVFIDPTTNATVAAGMITTCVSRERVSAKPQLVITSDPVTPAERLARYRNSGLIVPLGPRPSLAAILERRLYDRGCAVTILSGAADETLEALEKAGLLVLFISRAESTWDLPADDPAAVNFVIAKLEESGALLAGGSLTGGEGI